MDQLVMEPNTSLHWRRPSSRQGNCKEPTIQLAVYESTPVSKEALEELSRGCGSAQIMLEYLRRSQEDEGIRLRVSPKSSSLLDPSCKSNQSRQTARPVRLPRRYINAPPRRSSSGNSQHHPPAQPAPSTEDFPLYASSPTLSEQNEPIIQDDSQVGSTLSQGKAPSSFHTLPSLQTDKPDNSDAQRVGFSTDDGTRSWSIVPPTQEAKDVPTYSLERHAEALFGADHFYAILDDPKSLLRFTEFLSAKRSESLLILTQYLEMRKALQAISYANNIINTLESTGHAPYNSIDKIQPTKNDELKRMATETLGMLVREDLPAYIAYTWSRAVAARIHCRITGTLAPHLRESSQRLAGVFCLTDPTRVDNPIVLASEEFARTTQYGMRYAVGRNCRFLQGPRTSIASTQRMKAACAVGREHCEVLVNYRRDGSPFLNFLMMAPLLDNQGQVRYFIGAHVDVSELLKDCTDMEAFAKLVNEDTKPFKASERNGLGSEESLRNLSKMLTKSEAALVRKHAGTMYNNYVSEFDCEGAEQRKRRVVIRDESHHDNQTEPESDKDVMAPSPKDKFNGHFGVFQHYLLVGPRPPYRILFTSPSMYLPGILQSQFFHRIGSSPRIIADLRAALAEGNGATARIHWLYRADENGEGEGRPRWIHCTPLLHHPRSVGMYMIVLVDEEDSRNRRCRKAPPLPDAVVAREYRRGSTQRTG